MQTMTALFKRFLADQSGATSIEYALIAGGIALAIITSVNSLGTRIFGKFSSINTSLR
jgi:pilus assembly protein Flp/PilA